MKLEGFIGPAYTLDSVNVDAQRCVNLYPEVIESGRGKEAQVAYLRATPGLEEIAEVGNGPIRLVHTDSIGRVFVVSANQVFSLSKKVDWRYRFDATPPAAKNFSNTDVNTGTDQITITAHGFFTGLKVQFSGSATFPAPLTTGVDYYVIRVDANTIKLAVNFADAVAGTAINITGAGNNSYTFTPQAYSPLLSVKHTDINFTTSAFTKPDHGYPNGLAVVFKATGTYPTEIVSGTTYYVTNRTTDTFQLATSLANALAGTSVSLTDPADEWTEKLLGDEGEYGGSAVTLAASSGPVKAASMSFGGDGTDSSTVFVDGSNNYLLKDDVGTQTFGILGEVEVAQAVMNIADDITMQSFEEVEDLVSNCQLNYSYRSASPLGRIRIDFYRATNTVILQVTIDTDMTLTTAELVEYLNTGNTGGKNIILNSSPPGGAELYSPGRFVLSGGGSEMVSSAFTFPGVSVPFALTTVSGAEYGSVPTATQIVWSDGYFILNEFGTNRFWVSDLQSFNVNALSFASSEGSPDILMALAISNRYLYALNEKTTEIYANTGNADFPFERIQGGLIEVGLAAEYSVAKSGSVLCWLGRTAEGRGVVYAAEGLQPRRISTHAIEHAIRGYADISTAKGFAYQEGGHPFYVLNFDEATWVYDFATGLWHERAFTNEGDLERHRAEYYAYDIKRDLHLVADYETNQIFQLKEDKYTDDGDAITRLRASPHTTGGLNWVFYSKLQLDMETGIGLDGGVQGSSPTVMLDFSDDGGHTWSSESWALADAGSGQIGDFKKRVIWRRLGKSRDRVWRVTITDPVKVVLLSAHIDATAGAS